jgi:hypothetical protein
MSDPAQMYPAYQAKRARPVELTIYSLDATLISLKLEVSGNYHLVLQGGSGATMIASAPNPDPEFVSPSSRRAKEIEAVRKAIDAKFFAKPSTFRPTRVRIAGVGFFDRTHGQAGVAPNGIELYPVTNIKFLD